MKRFFTSIHPLIFKTTASGRRRKKPVSIQAVCWSREPSSLPASWFLQVSAMRVRDACVSLARRPKSMLSTTWRIFCLSLSMTVLGSQFILQQDGALVHGAKLAQDWLTSQCPDFIDKDSWPPNSPDLNPLDYAVWGAMLETYNKLTTKPKNIPELKNTLQIIWHDLPLETIQKSVLGFRKRLQACIKANGGHFEHSLHKT